jgi:hypothetical protein
MFSCRRCGYETKLKWNLKNHLKKKIPCDPTKESIERKTLLKDMTKPKIICKVCDDCGKGFTAHSNFYRHKSTCKGIKIQSVAEDTSVDDRITELEKMITELKAQLSNRASSKTSIHINNIQNNGGQNTINVVPFQNTKPDINVNQLPELLKMAPISAVMDVVKHTHFNHEKPEQMNAFISNLKDDIGRYFDGEGWTICEGTELVDDLFNSCRDAIDNLTWYVSDMYEKVKDDDTSPSERTLAKEQISSLINLINRWEQKSNSEGFEIKGRKRVREILYSKKEVVKKVHGL